MKTISIVLLALAVSGCVSQPTFETPSGLPEATLHHVDADCVRNDMMTQLLRKRYIVIENTPTSLVMQAPSPSAGTLVAHFDSRGGFPEERHRYTFVRQGDALRVLFSGEAVVHRVGGTRIAQLPLDARNQSVLQEGLNNIAKRCPK